MLAVAAISVGWKAVLYAVVVALFVLAVIAAWPARAGHTPPSLRSRLAPYALAFVALGFAVAAFVTFWTYWSLS